MSSRVVQGNHARNRSGRLSHNRSAQSYARHEVGLGEGRPGRSVPGLDQELVGSAVREALHGVGLLPRSRACRSCSRTPGGRRPRSGSPGHVAPGELGPTRRRPSRRPGPRRCPDGAAEHGSRRRPTTRSRRPGPDQEAVGHAVGEVGDLEGGALLVERVGPVEPSAIFSATA